MKTSMNLLPERCLWRNLLRVRVRQWSLTCFAVLLISVFAYYRQYGESRKAANELAALERLYTPVKALQDDLSSLQARSKKLAGHQEKVQPLVDNRPLLTLLGHVSGSAAASGTQLRVESFQFRRSERSRADNRRKDDDERTENPNTLSLQGEADDYVTIMKFVTGLRDTKAFLARS